MRVSGTVSMFAIPKSKRQRKYRSIIADVFDGTIVSSVQCLTCDRVSHSETCCRVRACTFVV